MSKLKAELIVFGGSDFDPRQLQASIGLAADEIHHIGDVIGRSIRKHASNSWIISSGYSECTSLMECLTPLLHRLEPFWGKFRLVMSSNVEIQLSVAAYICDSAPDLNLEKHILAKLAEIGASLDIDIVVIDGKKDDIRSTV